jgi:hypothetical protein
MTQAGSRRQAKPSSKKVSPAVRQTVGLVFGGRFDDHRAKEEGEL